MRLAPATLLSTVLFLVPFIVGCGPNPPTAIPNPPTTITIETYTPPALVTVRDEASAEWQSLALAGGNTFSFEATGARPAALLGNRCSAIVADI